MIKLYGINHRTTLDLREKYALTKKKIIEIIEFFKDKNLKPFLILNTCNRIEFYFNFDRFVFLNLMEKEMNYHISDDFYYMEDFSAVNHLVEVICGLDSQIIGETEIVSQVKEAYFLSKKYSMTDRFFDNLFQFAFKISKVVRKNTNISYGKVSLITLSFEIIKKHMKEIDNLKFLILGTGEIAEKFLLYIRKFSSNVFLVSGKNYQKALKIGKKYKISSIFHFKELPNIIEKMDIIITATKAPHYLIDKKFKLKNKAIIFDVSFPRNVDPEISNIYNVKIYNLEDLKNIRDENLKIREISVPEAKNIIEKFLQKWEEKLKLEFVLQN